MSNRPAVKSAFESLRPSIVREPSRSVIAPQDESKLLQTPVEEPTHNTPPLFTPAKEADPAVPANVFSGATLLTRKKREVLIPVTFRIPYTLKEQLNEVAKKHELNQTDLINEGIELNLRGYR